MIKDERTTPKVIVAIVCLKLPSGNDATRATDIAPRMPPSTTICRHTIGIFSFVNLFVAARIGYVDAILATNTAMDARIIKNKFC